MTQCWERNPTDRPHFAVIHEKLDGLASSKMVGISEHSLYSRGLHAGQSSLLVLKLKVRST